MALPRVQPKAGMNVEDAASFGSYNHCKLTYSQPLNREDIQMPRNSYKLMVGSSHVIEGRNAEPLAKPRLFRG